MAMLGWRASLFHERMGDPLDIGQMMLIRLCKLCSSRNRTETLRSADLMAKTHLVAPNLFRLP